MGDIPPPQTSSPTLPSAPSEMEAERYYHGLPSAPRLVARSSTTPWKKPRGLEAYLQVRELRPVGNHAIEEVWEDKLAFELHALLESMKVKWTSTDVVRMGIAKESSAPVILWVGVKPASLSGDRGVNVAFSCRHLLERYNVVDVDVEIRESVVTRSAGPQLLAPSQWYDPDVDAREPLTPTLPLPICAKSTPWVEGAGGIFIGEGSNKERLLLLTPRHVVLPDMDNNQHFEHRDPSQPRHEVTLFGQAAFKKYLESIEEEIEAKAISCQYLDSRNRLFEGKDDVAANKECNQDQYKMQNLEEAMEELSKLQKDVLTRWITPESRLLGHVILSPPVNFGFGSEGYIHDWALVEIDASKVNASNFDSNAIDLGTRISMIDFVRMVNPRLMRTHFFTYPADRLLRINSTISDEELRSLHALDQNCDSSLMIKRGNATGLTVGRANNICSYVRNYFDDDNDDIAKTSKAWAILSRNSKSGTFSEKGDSGSIIVDGRGRAGGLLIGGTGTTRSTDITYATPIDVILKHVQELGVHSPHVDLSRTA
ncbi:hypothetical protein EWM64_g5776 [Hericium alpestre]|uniref:Peptidase S1 domain-containing protein n=1 Tax=Hericium alpestre TaxID=135208 RepID=A0A4Y9ZW02_9AGAM|nr:hypothetical protein EWM64_g5776 [Hericium alpestre]